MRLFFDTNILLDLIDERRTGHQSAKRLEKHLETHNVSCLCAWHSLAIIDYVGGKAFGRQEIHQVLEGLLNTFELPSVGTNEAKTAFQYLSSDFEDALQIAIAVAGRAEYILTNNPKDFSRSPIPCKSAQEMALILEQIH